MYEILPLKVYCFHNYYSFLKYTLNAFLTSEEQEGTVEYLIEMAHYLRK